MFTAVVSVAKVTFRRAAITFIGLRSCRPIATMVWTSVMVSPCVRRLSSDCSSMRRMELNVPDSRSSISSRRL